MGLGANLGIILLETAGLLATIAVLVVWLGRRGARVEPRVVAALLIALAAAVLAVGRLHGAGAELDRARRSATTQQTGLQYCFTETGASSRLAFVQWLRRQIPPHGIYDFVNAGEPDAWCLTLALLPRLPTFGADRPGWFVAFGSVPPWLSSAIARHERSVQVFAPGFALARERH